MNQEVLVVDMPNGKHSTTGEGNRIYRAAFTKKRQQEEDQIVVFPGFICQGEFGPEETEVLRDYGWEPISDEKMWRHLNNESVRYTASALDLRVFSPKQSLVFVIKPESAFY